eukprot:7774440-Karenia_brevis.AAC.1
MSQGSSWPTIKAEFEMLRERWKEDCSAKQKEGICMTKQWIKAAIKANQISLKQMKYLEMLETQC